MMPNPTNIQKLNIKIIQISRRIIKFRITLFISFLSSTGMEALSLKKKKKKENAVIAVAGILKKWQLIFYGTATNPIRIRTRQFNPVHSSYASVHYPYPVDDDQLALGHRGDVDFFPSSTFQGYQGYPYVGAASNVQASVATLDGSSAPILTNRLPGDTSSSSSFDSPPSSSQVGDESLDTARKILHDCDPQCDPQGCYGKGPTQCIACKNYRLDK